MLHLWLHLKSDNWAKWREVQDRGGKDEVPPPPGTANNVTSNISSNATGSNTASSGVGVGAGGVGESGVLDVAVVVADVDLVAVQYTYDV